MLRSKGQQSRPFGSTTISKAPLKNGFKVVIPPDLCCWGAVSHHQGELELTGKLDAVLVAASACGHTIKPCDELLSTDVRFRAPVQDVQEFLTKHDLSSTSAELVASAKIGCTMQLRRHLADRTDLHHPMEMLAASAGLQPLG